MMECKEAFAQHKDIKFPQDLIKSVDPISILAMIGEKMPGPLKTAYSKALELAAFAPLMPILDKLKDKDLEGALAVVMSSAAVLKVTAKFDPEMPRNILKKVLQNAGFTAAVQKMLSKLPANMQSPLKALQSLSQDLEGDMDEMMEKLQGVMMECKEAFAQHKDIKFPQDLIKSVDPISILAMIGEKMPGPLKTAYSKALELAAFAPLMPILDKLKNKDFDGVLAGLLSSCSILRLLGSLGQELPRKVFKAVLLHAQFQESLKGWTRKLEPPLRPPLACLQLFSENLDCGYDELMDNFEDVTQNFVDYRAVFSKVNFKFPQDLIRGVKVPSIMMGVQDACTKALAPPSHADQDESTDEDEEDDDDEAEDDDDVEEEEVKGTNFIDMIDKVLSKVDPAKFLVMIEKLNAALPPPGQSALEPFIVILQQACEVKAQLQGKVAEVSGQVGFETTRGSVPPPKPPMTGEGVELTRLDDVMIDVEDEAPPQQGPNIARIIIGAMALFGTVTIGLLIAMAVSKDCGCNSECDAAKTWAAACPAFCDC